MTKRCSLYTVTPKDEKARGYHWEVIKLFFKDPTATPSQTKVSNAWVHNRRIQFIVSYGPFGPDFSQFLLELETRHIDNSKKKIMGQFRWDVILRNQTIVSYWQGAGERCRMDNAQIPFADKDIVMFDVLYKLPRRA